MADQGTSTDVTPAHHETDPAIIKAYRIDPHLVNLMWDEPFYSRVLRPITKIRTTDIPTAGVLAKDGSINMWWNPAFMAKLDKLQTRGLLKHECLHLILEHTTNRRKDPHRLWNWATDLAINSMIPENELPHGGLIPGKAFDELTPEKIAEMKPENVERYNRLSAKIASLEKGKSSEFYFGELQDVADDIEQSGDGGEGGEGMPGPMDDHDGWGDLSEEDKELVKQKIKESLREAVNKCDSNGQWGSVPSDMRGRLRAMISTEVDWRALLRNFLGRSQRANRSSTIKRINRKYPYIHPGRKTGHTANVACYVDMSGSVDDAALSLLYGELNNLARKVTFTFIPFDSEVDEASSFEWRRGQKKPAMRFRCGGTSFKAVAAHAEKNRGKFDAYIVLTDGEASDPGPSRMRRAWIIVPGRDLIFTPPKGDIVIKMREAKRQAA